MSHGGNTEGMEKASRGGKINRGRRRRERLGGLTGSRINGCDVSSDWKREEEEDEIMRRGR